MMLGLRLLFSHTDTVCYGAIVNVTVTIKNFGTNPQDSIPVYYKRGTSSPVNATWTGAPLNLGETATYTFATTFTAPIGTALIYVQGQL